MPMWKANDLYELLHHFRRDASAAEPAIVVEVLHGDESREIAEQRNTVAGTIDRRCIAQGAHLLREAIETVEAFDTAAGRGDRWALAHCVHPDPLRATKVIAP